MRDWRRWLSAVLLLGVIAASIAYRDDMLAAWREIRQLSAGWIAVLAALAALMTLCGGLITKALAPSIRLRHAVMAQQAALAANNTAIGSGPVSLGVRVMMLRSWGLNDATTGVVLVGAGVLTTLRAWLATGTIAVIALSSTARQSIDLWLLWALAAMSVVVLTTTAVAIWWSLRERGPLTWIAIRAQRLSQRVGRRSRRCHRVLHRIDIECFTDRFRLAAHEVVTKRGLRAIGASLVELTAMILVPIAVVRAFGITAEALTATEIVAAFLIVKMVAGLTPVPGGIGITELGLTAALARFGAPDAPALAAVLTYRTITFLLPILVGGISLALWRRQMGRRPAATDSSDSADVDPTSAPLDESAIGATGVPPTPPSAIAA